MDTIVQFHDRSKGGPTFWDWDFGDGSEHSSEQNPLHSYALSGEYYVTLISGNNDQRDRVTVKITLSAVPIFFTFEPYNNDTAEPAILYGSPDLITWSVISVPAGSERILLKNGTLLAVGYSGDTYYSTDAGTTWTLSVFPTYTPFEHSPIDLNDGIIRGSDIDVVNNNFWIGLYFEGDYSAFTIYSSDGINWEAQTVPELQGVSPTYKFFSFKGTSEVQPRWRFISSVEVSTNVFTNYLFTWLSDYGYWQKDDITGINPCGYGGLGILRDQTLAVSDTYIIAIDANEYAYYTSNGTAWTYLSTETYGGGGISVFHIGDKFYLNFTDYSYANGFYVIDDLDISSFNVDSDTFIPGQPIKINDTYYSILEEIYKGRSYPVEPTYDNLIRHGTDLNDPGSWTMDSTGIPAGVGLRQLVTTPYPHANFIWSFIDYTSAFFTNLSLHGSSWDWTFGDGSYSTAMNPTHSFPNFLTDYSVTLTTSNITGSDSTTKIVSTSIMLAPVANFTWGLADPVTVNFSDLSLNTPASWDWTFGDSSYSTLQNPSHVYTDYDSDYTVTLLVSNEMGSDSTNATIHTLPLPVPPSPPVLTDASSGNETVTVTWSPVEGAVLYTIYYAMGSTVDKNGTVNYSYGSPDTVIWLTNDVLYAFAISAWNSDYLESDLSNILTATPAAPPPPEAPVLDSVTEGDNRLTIAWSPVVEATSYNLYWKQGSTVTKLDGTKITSATSPYLKKGLADSTEYAFGVTASGSNGESVLSNVITGIPRDLPYLLEGWWKGEDNTVDSVNGNDGTWVANEAYAAGETGDCFKFGADAGILKISNTVNINFSETDRFTISEKLKFITGVWGWTSNFHYISKAVVLNEYPITGFTFALYEWYTTVNMAIQTNAPGLPGQWWAFTKLVEGEPACVNPFNTDGTVYDFYTWQDIKITYDNGRWEIYINDIKQSPDSNGYFNCQLVGNTSDYYLSTYNVSGAEAILVDEFKIARGIDNLVGWWKGEGDLVDSIGGHDGILQGSGRLSYVPGAVGQAFDINFTDPDAGSAFYVPSHSDFNVDPTGNFKLTFYIKLKSADIYRDNYLITKDFNYSPGLVNDIDWGIRIVNGSINFVVYLGSHTNTEFPSGGTVAYDDAFHYVECTYNNGYWRVYVDGVDESINTGVQHFISNHTDFNLEVAAIYNCIGQTGANFTVDELRISRGSA